MQERVFTIESIDYTRRFETGQLYVMFEHQQVMQKCPNACHGFGRCSHCGDTGMVPAFILDYELEKDLLRRPTGWYKVEYHDKYEYVVGVL